MYALLASILEPIPKLLGHPVVTEKINVNKCYFRIVRNKNIIFLKIQPRRERDIWTPARVDNLIHISG